LEGKIRLLSGSDGHLSKTLKVTLSLISLTSLTIFQAIADCEDILRVNPLNAEMCEIVKKNQESLIDYLKGDMRGLCCKDLENHLKQITADSTASDSASKCSKKAKFILQHALPAEMSQLKERLRAAHIASNESLTEMEKWGTRYKETSQHLIALAEEDMEWMTANSEDNIAALQTMRSLIPINITELSVTELLDIVKREEDGDKNKTEGDNTAEDQVKETVELTSPPISTRTLYTQELALEIKSNKLLHWLVTHSQDIAQMNFLMGEHRQYFVNLEGLDIIEMRALRMVLPDRFELDGDGKKAEWRERFITRLKQLVSQDRQEYVKGGWDPESGRRVMVQLPPLKEELRRRPVYFYRTASQLQARLKQYQDKETLLLKKSKQLMAADQEEREHRLEYDTVLEETRDVSFKALYGVEKLNQAKESAKREWRQAEMRRNELRSDVMRIEKSIASLPVTKEQFISFMKEQETLLLQGPWREDAEGESQSSGSVREIPVLIQGKFDRNPQIVRVERSAAKFQSAEQEAEGRKMELTNLSSGIVTGDEARGDEGINEPLSAGQPSLLEREESDTPLDANRVEATPLAPAAAPLPESLPRVSRRVSVNPELAKVLNSMMLSSNSKPEGYQPLAKRDSNRDTSPDDSVSTPLKTAVAPTAQPTPTKPIRSKNLKVTLPPSFLPPSFSSAHISFAETASNWRARGCPKACSSPLWQRRWADGRRGHLILGPNQEREKECFLGELTSGTPLRQARPSHAPTPPPSLP
jgi:hypothetical protein